MTFSASVGTADGNIKVKYIHLCELCVYDGDSIYNQGWLPGANTVCFRCGVRSGEGIFDARAEADRWPS